MLCAFAKNPKPKMLCAFAKNPKPKMLCAFAKKNQNQKCYMPLPKKPKPKKPKPKKTKTKKKEEKLLFFIVSKKYLMKKHKSFL